MFISYKTWQNHSHCSGFISPNDTQLAQTFNKYLQKPFFPTTYTIEGDINMARQHEIKVTDSKQIYIQDERQWLSFHWNGYQAYGISWGAQWIVTSSCVGGNKWAMPYYGRTMIVLQLGLANVEYLLWPWYTVRFRWRYYTHAVSWIVSLYTSTGIRL